MMSPISNVIFVENMFVTCSRCGYSTFQSSHNWNANIKVKTSQSNYLLNSIQFERHDYSNFKNRLPNKCVHIIRVRCTICASQVPKISRYFEKQKFQTNTQISLNNQICILTIWFHNIHVWTFCLAITR